MGLTSLIIIIFTVLIIINAIMIIFFFVMLQRIKMDLFNSHITNARKHDEIERLVRSHFVEIINELKNKNL